MCSYYSSNHCVPFVCMMFKIYYIGFYIKLLMDPCFITMISEPMFGSGGSSICKNSRETKTNLNGPWSDMGRCTNQPHSEKAIMMRYVIDLLALTPSIVGNTENN